MYGRAESLNLATAAAVLLYATATAQRSAVGERTRGGPRLWQKCCTTVPKGWTRPAFAGTEQ